MNDTAKSALAELIGTFTLVFIGAGAGAVLGHDSGGHAGAGVAAMIGVALAHGLALLVIVYAWGSISGAHVNPAVTLGILITGRIPIVKAVAYWIAQFAGAAAAAYLLKYLLPYASELGATTGSLTDVDPTKTVILEAILTFFLLVAVFASGIGGRSGNAAGVAIGLVLAMDILMGGSLTGASMNPARTFGPWLANGDMKPYLWMYFVGPFAGGAAGALLYHSFLPAHQQPPVDAAQTETIRHKGR